MQTRTRTGTKIYKDVDIHRNPCLPGESRIPVDVCDYIVDDFLKNEIIATKLCACPSCDHRRHVLRRLQEIVREWRQYKKAEEAKQCNCGCRR